MSLLLLLALQAAIAGPPLERTRPAEIGAPAVPRRLAVTSRCDGKGEDDEVVVCAVRPERFRLPLPNERQSSDLAERAGGEAPTGMAAITPAGPCGLFEGQRRCGKREAARYGYGQGQDPLSILVKLGTKLVDPDAEIGEPAEVPRP